ncbi:MAG TPA: EAL domain-containing protein, partial [Alphaproteobacteria bacterium]|nr:EAL domain-containing protein [Alphaproteobacteria bacterium]
DGLYHPFASLIVGAIAGLWIAATVTVMVDDLLVEAVADFIVVVAIVRILIGLRYISLGKPASARNYRAWQLAYAAGAGAFALSLGMVTLLALMRVDNPALHLMLTTTTAGYAASITGRNAGRPWIALSQLYLASAPMCLGLVLHETTFYQVIGATLFLFMFGMTDITISVRENLVGALKTRRQNGELAASFESQAKLFDAALNNMSHGLAMFESDGKLLVWNVKFAQLLNVNSKLFRKGMPLDTLLDKLAADRNGERNAPLVAAITQSFKVKRARQNFARLSDGKVSAVSRRRMDNGNVVIVFEDVTEQAKAHDRIRQLAWTDELTGLMNRASFQEVFKKSLGALDGGTALALHLIDLDHFKTVNDTLGHPIGDQLLVEVARRIADVAMEEGHVARLGGDEFVIIQELSRSGLDARGMAECIIAALAQTFEIAGHRINIGASIGIALAPAHGRNPDMLLKRADMALYEAKSRGRHTIRFFEDDLDLAAQQRRQLELDIRTAVAEQQFSLVFQPIVEIGEGQIAAFETLIRWRQPARGFVSPGEFIPVAEETGLIIDIGRWVLEEACRCAAGWDSDAAVSVNFSAVQFQDRQFPIFLMSVLERTGLPPSRLELEITETALLDDTVANQEMLEQFRSIGVRISLDDFGTGYSSLSHLRTFPFNKIKIDGSFVRDLGRDASSLAVIRAVASIGRILDMTVVAECVESEEQLQFLASAGCNQIQGYLLGRPTEPAGIPALIAAHAPSEVKRLLAA